MKHANEYEERLIESGQSRVARYQKVAKEQAERHEADSKKYSAALVSAFVEWSLAPQSRESDEWLAKAAKTYFEHEFIWVD